MSTPENPTPNPSVEEAKKTASNLLGTVLELKQSKPQVFFGGIAAVVVLLIIVLTAGGSDEVLPTKPAKALSVGQNYVLKGVNSFDGNGKIRLVSVPGSIAAFDDTDEDPKEASCSHIPQDTPVKVLDFQDFSGKKNGMVSVEVLEGSCKGKKGWALAVDVQ